MDSKYPNLARPRKKLRYFSNRASPRKALASPVREAPLTDLEDDFLILEDDGPSCFSLRWKTDPNRATPRPQQKDQSHSSNDASADTLTKASQPEKDTAKLRSEGTADVKTKEKNATGGSSLIPVLTKSIARKKRDSSPQGDGPVEADHIEQDQKKKVNNPLSEPTTAGDLEPGGGAKPKPSQSKARTKTEKKVPRISKFQGYKVNPKTSRGRGRQSGKTMRLSAGAGQEPVVMEEECEAAADQDVSPVLQLAPSGQRRVKVPANRKAKEVGPSPTGEADSSQAGQLTQLAGKRKRIKPGPWWLNSPVNTQVTETDDTHTANKSKHNNKETKPARYSPVESGQEKGTSRPLFNQTTENKPWSNQTAEHKAEKPKRVRPKKQKTTSREEPARPEGQREEEEDEASTAEQQEEQQEMGGLSPMPSPLRQHTLTPSEKVFDWIYTRSPKCKPQSDITPPTATVTPSRSDAFPTATVIPSRSDAFPTATVIPSRSDAFPTATVIHSRSDAFPTATVIHSRSDAFPTATVIHSRSDAFPTATVIHSRSDAFPSTVTPSRSDAFPTTVTPSRSDAFPTATVTPSRSDAFPTATVTPSRSDAFPSTVTPSRSDAFPTTVTPSRQWHQAREAPEKRRRRKAPWNWCVPNNPPENADSTSSVPQQPQPNPKTAVLKGFKSGPSSMIELEYYEENDDFCVRSFRVTPHPSVHQSVPPGIVLSVPEAVTELCATPLRAITLQLEDKANLREWMALLWPATGKQGGQISPDHFQWFSYRDRALGYKMDLLAETFSNGTILLGSYMKKPLLVDHSATTVYNLLTSSVSVTINGKENHYNPGQTFMVPCGCWQRAQSEA
ncbi:uncharacterized protein ACWYII_023063 isoform 2-T2 [Salvelinus alpinus]